MHLYEMVGIADENGRTYISPYGTYSKEDGFDLRPVDFMNYRNFEQLLNQLVHEDCWKLKVDKKKMTKAEIEKALGYEIDIIGDDSIKFYKNFREYMTDMFGLNDYKH